MASLIFSSMETVIFMVTSLTSMPPLGKVQFQIEAVVEDRRKILNLVGLPLCRPR